MENKKLVTFEVTIEEIVDLEANQVLNKDAARKALKEFSIEELIEHLIPDEVEYEDPEAPENSEDLEGAPEVPEGAELEVHSTTEEPEEPKNPEDQEDPVDDEDPLNGF